MANPSNDQPGRAQPNESENQPGYEPEDEAQRGGQRQGQGQGDLDDPSERKGFDERRQDDVSSPPPGGVDPDRDRKGRE